MDIISKDTVPYDVICCVTYTSIFNRYVILTCVSISNSYKLPNIFNYVLGHNLLSLGSIPFSDKSKN